MDTKEFLIEYNRMCHSYVYCYGCPLRLKDCKLDFMPIGWQDERDYFKNNNPEHFGKIIAAVEKWSKKHPKEENEQ